MLGDKAKGEEEKEEMYSAAVLLFFSFVTPQRFIRALSKIRVKLA